MKPIRAVIFPESHFELSFARQKTEDFRFDALTEFLTMSTAHLQLAENGYYTFDEVLGLIKDSYLATLAYLEDSDK